MDPLLVKQEDQWQRLQKAFQNYKKSPKERITPAYIEARLEQLENLYTTFINQHTEIISQVSADDRKKLYYFKNDTIDAFEEVYLDYKVKMKEDLRAISPSTSRQCGAIAETSASTCEVRLPQINLPSFSGAYDEWQTFYDMFVSLIHENTSLSGVQKLHYLKSSLSGEPANLLKNLTTIETNYAEAWKLLIQRYNNLRYNTNEIMKKLFYQRNIPSDSAVGLKQLLDTTTACLKSLKNLKINVDHWDVIVNYLVVSKLDPESRKQWEIHVSQSESNSLPTWFCRQSTCCRRCGKRHHSLLHLDRKQEYQNQAPAESKELSELSKNTERDIKISTNFAHETQSEVLLATAVVKIKSDTGYSQIVRALVDQGSEASFINEATVQALGLKRSSVNGVISEVGDGETRTQSMVSFQVESRHNSFTISVNAYVLSTLTSFIPNNSTFITDWPEIENLSLADPHFGEPSRVDIILGVDVLSEIILEGLKRHPTDCGPIAQNTQFGWILSGRVKTAKQSNPRIISLHLQVKEDQQLSKFWEIERGSESIEKRMTKDEIICEEIFEKTITRDENGRYVVTLPYKDDDPQCFRGKSKETALRRFISLEKKLLRNPRLYDEYKKVIADYINQSHMVKVTDDKSKKVFYLPHHAVVREDKDTTKVRCVFDASCKASNNVSLNDCFIIGPKLQQDLRHILMRWRLHPYCVVADIEQMYRQIRVRDEDTDSQRILWRFDPNQELECYKLVRLTFGTSCAPYLAVKCLQQLAKDEQLKYPIAAKIILEDFYMDDLLSGGETEDEVIEIYEQLNKVMKAGGFNLQKWCTNSEKLLKYIKTDKQRADSSLVFKENDMVKVLGISWNKNTDRFEYIHKLPETECPITKRKILSEIARLYDPLGWIAPVVVTAKVYMQKLWKSGLSWDDEVTQNLLKEWLEFKRSLVKVKDIIIPRWLQVKRGNHVELHAFADASQTAYAAAVYVKARDEKGNYNVNLVTARTRVAPVEKEVSIPRLELCAALLAAQLISEVSQVLKVSKENLYAWSDSTVVLAWLRGEPSRWTTFVSNRVSEILTMMGRDQWNHVGTRFNPADCASRGLPAEDLKENMLWWHGPEWLKDEDNIEFPVQKVFTTEEEQRPVKAMTTVIQLDEEFIWRRFSRKKSNS
ncbi:uncharacterized protein LOC123722956 [Papilio machaon]|uniref:uncharacterized protein LOC123722956 n=1 Tax=Papilio machaon TaxID=76193 RepID=UPI001E665ECC|nr:uncharacterized protein LOC123722956 [Papilio machaon]